MTDILTNSASIPYGTWGGGRSLTQSKSISIPANNVPYTYGPLIRDIYIGSDLTDTEPLPVILNMAYYARNNISNYQNITEISSGHLPTDINTSLAKDWSCAFNSCKKLISLPDPFYNTSNATNMVDMFNGCTNLTTIPNFDTSKVISISYMFNNCSNLTTIPNFDTSNVTNISYTFYNCYNLATVPNFDTSNVISMDWIFYNCTNLTTVPNFDTSNVTEMGYMFYNCSNLTTVPNFDTSNVTGMNYMFTRCSNLTTVPNFDTSNVTGVNYMFTRCSNLTTVPNFDTSNVTGVNRMFYTCSNLTTVPIFDISNVTDMSRMFYNCSNIKGNLYIESDNVTDAGYMFYNCTNYTKNIYCHADTTTYNTIYAAMGNNTYNSNWNAYLKTFGSEPIPLLKIADAFDENGKQDTVNYVFRTPLPKINLYIDYNNEYQTYILDIANVTPYQDLNISVQFNIPSRPNTSGLQLPIPLDFKIINRDTNEEIYASLNPNDPTRYTTYNVNYYLGI